MRAAFDWLMQIQTTDEDNLRRGRTAIVVALCMFGVALLALPLTLLASNRVVNMLTIAAGILGYIVSIGLVRAGRVNAGGFLLISVISVLILLSSALGSGQESHITTAFYLTLPLLVAGLIVRPALIWIVLAANLLGMLLLRIFLPEPPTNAALARWIEINAAFLQLGATLFIFLGAQLTSRALGEARRSREQARESARALAELNTNLEQLVGERTQALEQALNEIQSRANELAGLLTENEQQRSAIRELSVPVLPISDTILVMPLIGAFDNGRLADVQNEALRQLERSRARELLIDITGVPVVDTHVSRGLMLIVQSARLMGARVTLSGIRPEVAQTIVGLGLDLQSVRIFGNLQSALATLRG